MAAKRKKEGFEEHLAELESIVDELESGELSLDGSLARYEEGVKRLKTCYELLRDAEKKVQLLVEKSDGTLGEETLEDEES
jgi:exodeoxyribonuclease VII small subunit